MSLDLLIGIGIGAIVVIAVMLFLQKKNKSGDELQVELQNHLNEMFPKILENANQQLISMADEKLKAEKQDIKTDLDNKKDIIEKLVEEVKRDLKDSHLHSEGIKQQIKDHQKITQELSATTEGLKKVLTNNQLRGQFGEQVAEDLLKMAGFVKGTDFEYNKSQGTTSSRPDFSIFLPDKTKINVDVKFPYANLQKATEVEDAVGKQQYMKAFVKDVKDKITQITTRDYINPEENTVDFVILFVPNEMIFSYIYDKMNDVWGDAMTKKVVLAGPFSFTAILRMVRQAYDNFRYQKNVHQIISHIREFEKQFDLYNQEFTKLGNQLDTAVNTFQKVDSTRSRQLIRVADKIRLDTGEVPKELPLVD